MFDSKSLQLASTIYVTKIPRSGVLISSMNFPKRTECQYLSSRQYSALNKDFQMDDVFVDPINKGMPLGIGSWDKKLCNPYHHN